MADIRIDWKETIGVIKPMHAVNNGVAQGRMNNFEDYRKAGFPYMRNHDASYCEEYGSEHCVDISAVFPDFDADPRDPASYEFTETDAYLGRNIEAGTKIFYRLGQRIEHTVKKYNVNPPKDFQKWAVVCEHIIRHYNEGWADGFRFNIEYWEIWNEPDGIAADGSQPNWSGTSEEYYDLYKVAATHLKKRFPHLKIGGPSMSSLHNRNGAWIRNFLASLTEDGKRVPLDFFSWHAYMVDPQVIVTMEKYLRDRLDEAGYTEAESILNEYNYVEGWTDLFISSIEAIIGMRGAAFTSASMAGGQASTLDMLMYYDARPCAFCGMFDFYTYRPLKGYYPFVMYSQLYQLGTYVECASEDEDLYVTAASGEDGYGIMLTHYRKDKEKAEKTAGLHIAGVPDGIWQAEILDRDRTMEKRSVTMENGVLELQMPEDCVILLTRGRE